ncbi:putative pentatricopeptide repeat-containing protein [Platanthera guangdongensis]|uniref:Pentatricopeptide repeat-containing protein n=1 Tax=Platanthera guangdongensis TaxID=2320717 RepID=A0ABR2LBX6_9ASPA
MLRRTFHRHTVSRIAGAASLLCIYSTKALPQTFEINTQLKELVKANRLGDARHVFDQMSRRDEISWTTIISGYVGACNPNEALSLFHSFLADDSLSPDSFVLSLAVKACASSPPLHPHGHAIHALSIKSGAISSVFVGSSFIDMYSRATPDDPAAALQVFGEMPFRNVVSWTSAITALVRSGHFRDALSLFADMRAASVPYDSHTYAIALKACADDGELALSGREIHAWALKEGQENTSFVANALVTLYSKSGELRRALTVFEAMRTRDVASWTTLISTYSQIGRPADAVAAFIHLLARPKDGDPNDYTYASVISACASLAEATIGAQIHAHAARRGFAYASSVSNALVTMYARAGLLSSALAVFRESATKDPVSWSAVIAAHAQEGRATESFALFDEMRRRSEAPATENTIASLLSASACAAVLDAGRQAHGRALTAGLDANPMVISALIAMYAKCGSIIEADAVFAGLRPADTVSWTAMITGYAEHGRSLEAIDLFNEMLEKKIKPDRVTYLGVLTACSHAGKVDEGLRCFDAMRKEGMDAEKEHYGCVADMLARSGRLREAERIVESMQPGMADEVVWTTLLRSCEARGDAATGSRAAARAVEMDPECAGARIAMANLYAKGRRWREAARIRKEMRENGVRKEVGWSWVAGGGGEVDVFVVAGRDHRRAEEVYEMIGLVDFGGRVLGTELELEELEGDFELAALLC